MERLDNYTELPSGMKEYLSNYGWHFSKKMYEWACENMKDRNNNKMKSFVKEDVDTALRTNGVTMSYKGYDGPYVYCMAKADFMGGSMNNEMQICKYVKDYLEDIDGYDTVAFTRFYADTIAKGTPILWEEMI